MIEMREGRVKKATETAKGKRRNRSGEKGRMRGSRDVDGFRSAERKSCSLQEFWEKRTTCCSMVVLRKGGHE